MDFMSIAKSRMMLRHTFFASLLVSTPTIADKSIPTAGTDMIRIYYNPEFLEAQSREVQLFVLAHEVSHKALRHGLRRMGRDMELWNIACDFAINIMLKDAGFTLWQHCYHDKFMGKPVNFAGMSAEQIYPVLVKMVEEDKKAGGKGKPSQQNGMTGDLREPAGMTHAEQATLERRIVSQVAQAVTAARMCGHMKGSLAHMIDGILNPPLTWQELLRDYCTKFRPDDESWSHRNRRHQNIYLPGRHSPAMGELVGIGDTSGSLIGSSIFKQIAGELEEIREQVKPDRVRWIWADDDECNMEEVFEPNDELVLHPTGGGGTDMRKPLSFIERYDPIVAVLATDCLTPWPAEPTPFPLIVLSNTKEEAPEWAMTIHI